MGEEAENKYVSQLQDVYNSCDTTGTGYLDQEELTELCRKLRLERQLPALLQTLLGHDRLARVHFEEFKEGFVAVLAASVDLGVSHEESSYLEPAVPEEIEPTCVTGRRRPGRWASPELQGTAAEPTHYGRDQQVQSSMKSQLRRSASLESVEGPSWERAGQNAGRPGAAAPLRPTPGPPRSAGTGGGCRGAAAALALAERSPPAPVEWQLSGAEASCCSGALRCLKQGQGCERDGPWAGAGPVRGPRGARRLRGPRGARRLRGRGGLREGAWAMEASRGAASLSKEIEEETRRLLLSGGFWGVCLRNRRCRARGAGPARPWRESALPSPADGTASPRRGPGPAVWVDPEPLWQTPAGPWSVALSLKSEEEAEDATDPQEEMLAAQGQVSTWDPGRLGSPGRTDSPRFGMSEGQIRDIWEELDVGGTGYLCKRELARVCRSIGLHELEQEDLEDLFRRLDRDGDGRVSFQEFEFGLSSHGPVSSTPAKQPGQLTPGRRAPGENGPRTASPPPSSSSACPRPFCSLDDGSGWASPAQILSLWAQEGVENAPEILKGLDVGLEERVSLAALAVALDKELLGSGSAVQRAAVASYRHALRYLEALVEQACRERDKAQLDLEKAEKRNLQLVRDVDEHHAAVERHHESRLRDLEQGCRGKLTLIRAEAETDRALLLQHVAAEQAKLEAEIKLLRGEKSSLRERLTSAVQEGGRLRSEAAEVAGKLAEAEKRASKLQKELGCVLQEKLGMVDPHSTELLQQAEHFAEIIREYELQSREFRDRNDELQSELERLRAQLESQQRRAWHQAKGSKLGGSLPPADALQGRDQLLLAGRPPAAGHSGALFGEAGACAVSIETELLLEQLKEQLQDLRIQLETQVNYYEREMELLKRSFERERKDIEQGFKLEISELEEQKADLEQLNMKSQEVIDGLREQLQKCAPSPELEQRLETERSEMEQYYAKEICSLGQRLAQERDQLEEEMRVQHRKELQSMRTHVDELQREKAKALSETDKLNQLSESYQQEVARLQARTLQLSGQLSELSLQREADRSTAQLLRHQLAETLSWREEEAAGAQQLQEASGRLEQELVQHQAAWQRERELLQQQLRRCREEGCQVQELEEELERARQECQTLRLTVVQLREELEERQDQEEHERLLGTAEERAEELERAVSNGQRLLEEKVTQLQEQRARSVVGDRLLKDLYVENAQLLQALQAAEQRHKTAENKNWALEDKLSALNHLLRRLVQASLSV
ncbi:ninein-like protein isoform X3 [Pelodiscus sinensis]|uniref:ninein-like protein isoform X3 n=1 Tax=Pelodiscus sinensis TaxID=13735 RepID=UPI003F6B71E1